MTITNTNPQININKPVTFFRNLSIYFDAHSIDAIHVFYSGYYAEVEQISVIVNYTECEPGNDVHAHLGSSDKQTKKFRRDTMNINTLIFNPQNAHILMLISKYNKMYDEYCDVHGIPKSFWTVNVTIQTSTTFRKIRKKGFISVLISARTARTLTGFSKLKRIVMTYNTYNFKLKKMHVFMHIECDEHWRIKPATNFALHPEEKCISQKKIITIYNMPQSKPNENYRRRTKWRGGAKCVAIIENDKENQRFSYVRYFHTRRLIERQKRKNQSRKKSKIIIKEVADIFSKSFERKIMDTFWSGHMTITYTYKVTVLDNDIYTNNDGLLVNAILPRNIGLAMESFNRFMSDEALTHSLRTAYIKSQLILMIFKEYIIDKNENRIFLMQKDLTTIGGRTGLDRSYESRLDQLVQTIDIMVDILEWQWNNIMISTTQQRRRTIWLQLHI